MGSSFPKGRDENKTSLKAPPSVFVLLFFFAGHPKKLDTSFILPSLEDFFLQSGKACHCLGSCSHGTWMFRMHSWTAWGRNSTSFVTFSLLTQPKEHQILNYILPTKYVIPKSLKVGHWLSKFGVSPLPVVVENKALGLVQDAST